jgi:N6-L-threonylcarbamoyladenine synthase
MMIKCRRAIKQTGVKRLIIAGGVSANKRLRQRLNEFGRDKKVEIIFPTPEFSTDNGAMIAFAGYLRLKAGQAEPLSFRARPRWDISSLPLLET